MWRKTKAGEEIRWVGPGGEWSRLYMEWSEKEGNPAITATWVALEDIMLSEKCQKKIDKYSRISLTCGV